MADVVAPVFHNNPLPVADIVDVPQLLVTVVVGAAGAFLI